MISIYLKKIIARTTIAFCCVCLFFLFTTNTHAQENTGLSLSVTPTLFQMSVVPSQAWNSSVKVINNNKYEITIYANVVNFAPQGEEGEGKFLPVFTEETDGATLAEWITISNEPFTIAPEQSVSIPFSVAVPNDASPGGHFSAILIGTKPPEVEGSFKVSTSQIVTSLFFVRVAGDVIEDGLIREFNTANTFVSTPYADFEVRFENKGNVHLQPQGEIVITNMWGKERGVIPINHQTHFGNVLPLSIRKFEFSWSGEQSFSDIGRYKAVITLAYGEDSKKFETRILYFYVIPIKAGSIVLGSFIAFMLFVRWSVKAYVRRMLFLAGVDPVVSKEKQKTRKSFEQEGDVRIIRRASLRSPVETGVRDLKTQLMQSRVLLEKIKVLGQFIILYKIFFLSIIVVCIALYALTLFVMSANKEQRDYEIIIDNADVDVKLSSEEILYNKQQEIGEEIKAEQTVVADTEQTFDLVLVNSSDTPGLAGRLQESLVTEGYTVSNLQSDFEKSKETSVIVYDLELQEEALTLSKKLQGALLSANPENKNEVPTITVYIGNDYATQ